MIIHDMQQGTPEWDEVRRGKFTASIASKLLTPTGKPSISYKAEIGRIIAEYMELQDPEPFLETDWMARGSRLEDEARRWFNVETGLDVKQVGFVESNDGMIGASPDAVTPSFLPTGSLYGIVAVELKVPKPSTHIRWLLDGGLPKEHKQQVHFTTALLDAPYGWFMSYCQDIEPLIIKVERDKYTEAMVDAIDDYKQAFLLAFKTITGADYETEEM